MINSVRNSVLSIINKNNYGYISPSDFNLFATQAQMDLFEDYFYLYNSQITKENTRLSGSGYADITKGLIEVIDSFSVEAFLSQTGVANTYALPSDYYLIDKIYYYSNLLDFGTTDGATTAFKLNDSTQNFASTVSVGSLVVNTTSTTQAYVTAIDSNNLLSISADIMTTAQNYSIYSSTNIREVERVTQNKIFRLTNSNLTAPNTTYPAYVLGGATTTLVGNTITVYPSTIRGAADIKTQYIRFPRPPKWTYVQLQDGAPLFNDTAADYQDFELPESDEPMLVNRILQYAGISIREPSVTKFGATEEAKEDQQQT
tara:strand:+ start:14684 stop:15631 length:948 start_codon:yes stop_codon:yes gene_type:complete